MYRFVMECDGFFGASHVERWEYVNCYKLDRKVISSRARLRSQPFLPRHLGLTGSQELTRYCEALWRRRYLCLGDYEC